MDLPVNENDNNNFIDIFIDSDIDIISLDGNDPFHESVETPEDVPEYIQNQVEPQNYNKNDTDEAESCPNSK